MNLFLTSIGEGQQIKTGKWSIQTSLTRLDSNRSIYFRDPQGEIPLKLVRYFSVEEKQKKSQMILLFCLLKSTFNCN